MKDLTQGPIRRHLITLATPIALGMIFQTLYYLVDLYFVGRLGNAALAGVGSAGNIMFIVLAMTQVLGVGTVALVSQAVGRKDQATANLAFNQSLTLSAFAAVLTAGGGYAISSWYTRSMGADAGTAEAGLTYLRWFIPSMALQFGLVAMGSALRGTGIAAPTMIVQVLSVLLNALLAPVLIAGWGTGRPMGVAGAGLASTISVGVAVIALAIYFVRREKYVAFDARSIAPRAEVFKRILTVGLPAGGEFALMFVYMAVIYFVIRQFGSTAQAGFGVGSRVMQSIFLPAMALSFASAPIAGQNFGAHHFDRVRETFRVAAGYGALLMGSLTLFCQWRPEALIGAFTSEPAVVVVGADFLRIISWNFVPSGIIFTCSSMFQGLGNTVPSLLSSASRLLTFVVPALWLSTQPTFALRQVWFVSFASVTLQLVVSLLLLRSTFRDRLAPPPEPSLSTKLS